MNKNFKEQDYLSSGGSVLKNTDNQQRGNYLILFHFFYYLLFHNHFTLDNEQVCHSCKIKDSIENFKSCKICLFLFHPACGFSDSVQMCNNCK